LKRTTGLLVAPKNFSRQATTQGLPAAEVYLRDEEIEPLVH
jgi:hypothetical protein